jgi:hypothetical protein
MSAINEAAEREGIDPDNERRHCSQHGDEP